MALDQFIENFRVKILPNEKNKYTTGPYIKSKELKLTAPVVYPVHYIKLIFKDILDSDIYHYTEFYSRSAFNYSDQNWSNISIKDISIDDKNNVTISITGFDLSGDRSLINLYAKSNIYTNSFNSLKKPEKYKGTPINIREQLKFMFIDKYVYEVGEFSTQIEFISDNHICMKSISK